MEVQTRKNRVLYKVPVVYYLSRNGQLEHPHFMEVHLSSPAGLLLRDVLNRLDSLRGQGMASLYAWSSKRNYKNGFVWHDLSDDDLIHPALGNEYILKGSELLRSSPPCLKYPHEPESESEPGFASIRRKTSRSLDLAEYKVYKSEIKPSAPLVNANAATQTDDKRRRRRSQSVEDDPRTETEENTRTETEENTRTETEENPRTEIGHDEISPPPSSSSPETVETLNKESGSVVGGGSGGGTATGNCHSGRFRASASAVVMHLISCGSFSLVPSYRTVMPRGASLEDQEEGREMNGLMGFAGSRAEEKEYFSGSLVELKKKGNAGGDVGPPEGPVLKRSSSYNAERSGLEAADEAEGFRAKCIPRRPKAAAAAVSKRVNDERAVGSRGSSGRADADELN